jgi:hypothetical protein
LVFFLRAFFVGVTYERIMGIGRWLRDQDLGGGTRSRLDEVMRSNIRHDLSARKQLNMELLLELLERLWEKLLAQRFFTSTMHSSGLACETYLFIKAHLHDGQVSV